MHPLAPAFRAQPGGFIRGAGIRPRPRTHREPSRARSQRAYSPRCSHVILCWLALLPARITENACGQTWPELRRELDRIHVGAFAGPAGTFRQRTEITKPQAAILKALDISAPPCIYQLNRRGGIAPTAPPPDTRRLTDAKARHLIGCTCVRLSGMAVLLLVRGYGMMTSLRAAVPVLRRLHAEGASSSGTRSIWRRSAPDAAWAASCS